MPQCQFTYTGWVDLTICTSRCLGDKLQPVDSPVFLYVGKRGRLDFFDARGYELLKQRILDTVEYNILQYVGNQTKFPWPFDLTRLVCQYAGDFLPNVSPEVYNSLEWFSTDIREIGCPILRMHAGDPDYYCKINLSILGLHITFENERERHKCTVVLAHHMREAALKYRMLGEPATKICDFYEDPDTPRHLRSEPGCCRDLVITIDSVQSSKHEQAMDGSVRTMMGILTLCSVATQLADVGCDIASLVNLGMAEKWVSFAFTGVAFGCGIIASLHSRSKNEMNVNGLQIHGFWKWALLCPLAPVFTPFASLTFLFRATPLKKSETLLDDMKPFSAAEACTEGLIQAVNLWVIIGMALGNNESVGIQFWISLGSSILGLAFIGTYLDDVISPLNRCRKVEKLYYFVDSILGMGMFSFVIIASIKTGNSALLYVAVIFTGGCSILYIYFTYKLMKQKMAAEWANHRRRSCLVIVLGSLAFQMAGHGVLLHSDSAWFWPPVLTSLSQSCLFVFLFWVLGSSADLFAMVIVVCCGLGGRLLLFCIWHLTKPRGITNVDRTGLTIPQSFHSSTAGTHSQPTCLQSSSLGTHDSQSASSSPRGSYEPPAIPIYPETELSPQKGLRSDEKPQVMNLKGQGRNRGRAKST